MANKEDSLEVRPGPTPTSVIDAAGNVLQIPKGWQKLPPGDAGLTRRLKALGPTWTVKEKKGRRVFSLGVWAKASQISQARREVSATRSTDAYQKKRTMDRQRREAKQIAYVDDFRDAVLHFLDFPEEHHETAEVIADLVTSHATPVGSGTVARTQRIPLSQRAGSAVIAWMRHSTTEYDRLQIRRVRGERRSVRRDLAQKSRRLLDRYRKGAPIDQRSCPLAQAIERERIRRTQSDSSRQ